MSGGDCWRLVGLVDITGSGVTDVTDVGTVFNSDGPATCPFCLPSPAPMHGPCGKKSMCSHTCMFFPATQQHIQHAQQRSAAVARSQALQHILWQSHPTRCERLAACNVPAPCNLPLLSPCCCNVRAYLTRCAASPLPPPAYAGNNRYYGGISPNTNMVNCMLWNALNANIPASYVPPCSGTVAVVLVPCNGAGATTRQVTIAQVPFSSLPVTCQCGPEVSFGDTHRHIAVLLPLPCGAAHR